MTKEEFREEQRTWSPTPQIPKLAPPVDRTRRTGGALGDTPGVEADIDWAKLAGGVLSSIPNFF
ncbi:MULTISPECIES: hypothetical protein [Streptomycetaceae]|uniref:hypothetical protein n=1 Tax=Streptomycetaceae TaxID=2062 RepID=UPI000938A080|nr:hypothetical protein [Streptomyces sp. CB02056]OKI06897.1 hypothetical protein AMK13_15925 [Streptomyces sp. CB02056]